MDIDDFYHEDFVRLGGVGQYASCHGFDHLETRLSRIPVDRVLVDADGMVRVTLQAGDKVSCGLSQRAEKGFEDSSQPGFFQTGQVHFAFGVSGLVSAHRVFGVITPASPVSGR